jgi:NADH dehydrogenase
VAGATGHLGGVVVNKLLAAGVKVKALGRHHDRLEPARAAGAEVVAVDLLDIPKLTEACKGVAQIVATATNNMGKGPTSPNRVDLSAYQNLCAAVRNTGVGRLLYVSFRGASLDAPVDIFRLKWYIEDAIRRSGVPHVIVRPTAQMDIWVDELLAKDIRTKEVATIFGPGTNVSNYIAVEDVAEFIVKILARPEIVNEGIDIGGPSNISLNDMAALIEKRLGAPGKRRHVPVPVMHYAPALIRPFNEVLARLMGIGYYSATMAKPFPEWKMAADRFGVSPRSVEEHVNRLPRT